VRTPTLLSWASFAKRPSTWRVMSVSKAPVALRSPAGTNRRSFHTLFTPATARATDAAAAFALSESTLPRNDTRISRMTLSAC
jgi:hypothetical protein